MPNVPVRTVRATRGKWLRAEPVAALYAEGRVAHVGTFAALEDQMCAFGADGLCEGPLARPARCAGVGADGLDDRRRRPPRHPAALSQRQAEVSMSRRAMRGRELSAEHGRRDLAAMPR